MSAARFTGASVPRAEDPRLLAGRGAYVDDLRIPGTLHAAFVRSPLPHARLLAVEVGAARALQGVHAVLTDADLREHVDDLTPAMAPDLFAPSHGALAREIVRLVGEPIAIVIADSRQLAEDAVALVELDLDPLPAVVDMDHAIEPDATVLFPQHGTNVTFRSHHRYGDTDAAFAAADHVVRERFVQHRHANVPMEGRAGLAVWSVDAAMLTYHASHQAPHALRLHLARLLRVDDDRVRVRCGDIGGAFGQKAGVGREDVAVCAAARLVGRPVKWIEDRLENLTVGGQAREERMHVEAAIDAGGVLLGLRARLVIDGGAYPQVGFPISGYANIMRALMPGAYRLEHYDFEAIAVTTNKATYVPYRGPWEVETWVRERLLDVIARVTGVDPVEVRRRNLWRDEELPRPSVTGVELIGISQRESLRLACDHIGYDRFRREQEAARATGRHLGIGIASFIEPAPVMPSLLRAMGFAAAPRTVQEARLRLEDDGSLSVFTSQQPHGQGHETTLAQLVADAVDVPLASVRVVHGDTDVTPFNMVGTGGSRAATLASGAVIGAAQTLRRRLLDVASGLWEIDPADLELGDGSITARGVPSRALTLEQVAARSPEPIEVEYGYMSGEGTWSQSTHACIVEVDVETGQVTIVRYLVVEDCGEMINPAIVEGQVRGGVVQGIGAVLFERSAYADDGTYLASTLMDYLLPTAADLPPIEIVHLESAPDDDVPFRGVGEGGAIGAPAALTNAIEDALAPFGAKVREQYLPPSRVLELCGVVAP